MSQNSALPWVRSGAEACEAIRGRQKVRSTVRKNQKVLRRGLTTGTCAAIAAKAAAEKLLTDQTEAAAGVRLPGGERVSQPVFPWGDAGFYTLKDAGDDPDVTNGTRICARAFFLSESAAPGLQDRRYFTDPDYPRIRLYGGPGVGRMTKPGLKEKVGEAAINPVPRRMIFEAVFEVLDRSDYAGLLGIEISVPEGEELAKHTFNPLLGIVGGISILGTSGIVEPMSEQAIVDTIEVLLQQEKNLGAETALLVPGNYGERYVRECLRLPERVHTVQCSNFIGEALDLTVSLGFSRVLLVGNIGKLVKLAAGIMNTHSRYADGRWEIFAAHAALLGADREELQILRDCVTTEEMLRKLTDWGLREAVMASVFSEMERHVRRRVKELPVSLMVYSESYGLLAASADIDALLDTLRQE